MSGGMYKRKNKERGPWFQIKCIKDIIVSKEVRGQDANYERGILKSWAKYPGYEEAKK